ncbi:hypothetical protein BDF19DRAFT_494344 [Syncephalis fuscata]|nr:hypothetical protein BDF19DRAFT_494344 [Syncephalis fuscata]
MANDARHVLHANNTAKVLLVIFCLTQSTQLLSFIILLGFDYIFLFIDVPTLPLFVSFIYVSILCLGVLVAVKRSQFGLAAYALFCAIHTGYSFFMLLVLGGSIDYHRFHTPFAGKSPAPHSIIELLDAPDTLQWYIDSNAAPFGYAAAVTFGEGHGETALYWLMTQLSWQLVLAMMGGGFGLALRWAYKQQELAWKLYGADATHEEHNDTNNTSNNNSNNNNNSHVGATKPQEQTVEQQFCEVPL